MMVFIVLSLSLLLLLLLLPGIAWTWRLVGRTQKRTNKHLLAISAVLAIGVLTGCQYCEPLLIATLVIGAIYKGLSYSSFDESRYFDQKI